MSIGNIRQGRTFRGNRNQLFPLRVAVLFAYLAVSFAASLAEGAEKGSKQKQKAEEIATGNADRPDPVAVVNEEPVPLQELMDESIRHFGEEVLENMVNRKIIIESARSRKIAVSKQEVEDEVTRQAERFGVPTDRWLAMLQENRNLTPTQYKRDVIWPALVLRKLAASSIEVSEDDMAREYETQFGQQVQARIIAVEDEAKAKKLLAQARKNPDEFGNLAKKHSVDASASSKGMIQPIRKFTSDENFEAAVFALQPGDISDIVQVGEQYIIVKCEEVIPAREVAESQREQIDRVIREQIEDRKLREVADDVMQNIQKETKVVNVMNDEAKSQEMPGVAATINGKPIEIREVADECVERYGLEVLDGIISKLVLKQALAKKQLDVTDEDMNEEIARAAAQMGFTKRDGSPDVEAWLANVQEEQKMNLDDYRDEVVWKTAALKLLVGDSVQVSDVDVQKGFEASFGPRVRCRAIFLNNMRDAQKVWEQARDNPTSEGFGDLAEKYSVHQGSKVLRGEVAPIQRHGGQPTLEKEAFALQPGEISGIVQVGEFFVILLCEGLTEPTVVDLEEVKDDIVADLHEKKLRIEMNNVYNKLLDGSTIDNFLAKKSQSGDMKIELPSQSEEAAAAEGDEAAETKPRKEKTASSKSKKRR